MNTQNLLATAAGLAVGYFIFGNKKGSVGSTKTIPYRIFEGYDWYKGVPLYRVESAPETEDEYVGEWATTKQEVQPELIDVLKKTLKGEKRKTFESLLRLGDSVELAYITAKNHKYPDSEMYRFAYEN